MRSLSYLGAWALSLLLIGACSGERSSSSEPAPVHDARPPVRPSDAAGPAIDAAPPRPQVAALPLSDDDEAAALRRLPAVSAWAAVVDRGRYLARRDQRGAVHGRLGGAVDEAAATGLFWLIDETDGAGSLSIRLALPEGIGIADLAGHDRLVAWGAWRVDGERRWIWQADKVATLPARAWSVAPDHRAALGHRIVDIATPPERAPPMSERSHLGGYTVFQVVRAADDPADGWEISDDGRKPPLARLYLPGERESYGGQDLRAPAEHWSLQRGQRYVVRLKRFLPAKPGELANVRALDAPRRIAEPAGRP